MTMIMYQDGLQKSTGPIKTSSENLQKNCAHCKVTFTPFSKYDARFCCTGCEGAWHVVHGLGLDRFYTMIAESRIQPALNRSVDYSVYDAEAFQAGFVRNLDDAQEGIREASLLIEGLTCYACVWLIRQAIEKNFSASANNQSLISMNINQATGAAVLTWNNADCKLSALIKFTESLGYSVMPHRGASLRTDQSALVRVGVGLFVMMNVMSFALAEYLAGSDGLDPDLESFLRWLSLALTSLSLAWTGREFFTNTWRSIKTRTPNIDAPILVGLISATLWSINSTIGGHGAVYYDSICAIVALVVTGRFVQQNVLRRNQTRMAALVNPRDGWVLVNRPSANGQSVDGPGWATVQASSVKKGELVRILPGEIFPVKVSCASNCAEVSFEQLRGEADWKTINKGEEIPAGALNGSTPIDVICSQNGAESYTESLARSIDRAINEKGIYNKWSDRAAWILFLVVFSVAGIVMVVIGTTAPEEAMRRTVALLLVACPCTFAIGVPLTFGTAMTQALREGVLFKSQRALEKLSGIRHFVFDKTGTLTEGLITVKKWTWDSSVDKTTMSLTLSRLAAADQVSSHHVARALSIYVKKHSDQLSVRPSSVRESQGLGLELKFGDDLIIVGNADLLRQHGITSSDDIQLTADTYVASEKSIVAKLDLEDSTRIESSTMINELKLIGCEIEILSGDTTSRTRILAEELAIDPRKAHGEATPGSKMLFVRHSSRVKPLAMVGNGLNDAGAMAHSEVSIAVAGSSSTAMNSADVCLLKPDVRLVSKALMYSIKARKRMLVVFGFALFYNLLGLSLAALGYVTPVIAAILMPISSLTITHVATSWSIDPRSKQIGKAA
jgi:Cu2+-exporting ATPase